MRNLVNSLLGGQCIGLFLTQAVFLLNASIPIDPMTLLRVGGTVALTYGLLFGLVLWVALMVFEEIRGSAIRPAWLSFRLLTWLFTVDLAMAAALLWNNLFYYRLYLRPDAIRAMAVSATTLSAAAAVLLVLALFHYSFGRRAALFGYALVSVTMVVSLLLPFAVRSEPIVETTPVPRLPLQNSPTNRRLTIIGIEGASMSYVLPAIAEGKLPNFARIIEGGASGTLRTLRPTESLSVWTSVATGKLPRQHGLKGFYRYRFLGEPPPFALLPHGVYFTGVVHTGMIKRSAVTSSQRRTETLWSILTSFGLRVGLVRWWGTYPAEGVDGFVVSELLHRQVWEQFDPPLPNLTYPEDLNQQLVPYVVRPNDIGSQELDRYVDRSAPVDGDTLPWEVVLRSALAEDRTYHRIGRLLKDSYDPEVYGLYLFGLDRVGHAFYRFQRPQSFGDVSDAELTKYGRVIEAYYLHLDSILGEYLQLQRPEETLVVLSGHGMEPLPLTRRIVETLKGSSYLSGYHDNGPDGLALFYGSGIAHGAKLQGASVVDITPTLLYLMGFPLGHDMEGTLLAGVLEESLSRSQPVTFISSYRNFLIEPRKDQDEFDLPSPLDTLPELLEPAGELGQIEAKVK